MSSQVSDWDLEGAYDRLNPVVRKWIRDQGWNELREIQARAIIAVLDRTNDILISAATAAGKTEAAFLPILSSVADRTTEGFAVVYVSPLKALINDQFRRLEDLCERMEIPVVKWHGDAPQSAKKKAVARPRGVALITPESIEALLIRRPGDARRLLGSPDFIVIDELHAFMQGPRGLHLASLLKRLDAMNEKPARRVGLSATIGDLVQAAEWLRPGNAQAVEALEAIGDAPELRLQQRGYVEPTDADDPDRAEGHVKDQVRRIALDDIADHLFGVLRGANNLVFGGSRRTVEATADRLRRRCEDANVPNEFLPHHGSLSKEIREELELRLKDGNLPTTAICTSTLELGVDIGSVKSVAQIGAPRSLSGLRQRLGRTGRRPGTPAILRIYVREPAIGPKSGLLDRLRSPTVGAVAAVRLLLRSFVEPPGASPETLSTLIHQIMSVIAERGGIRPAPLHALLCGPGPFGSVSTTDFADLLRHLGSPEVRIVEQAPDGILMLAPAGEALVQSRDFFAVFESAEEWRLVTAGRELGRLPISFPVHKESLVVFAGRRWVVQAVEERTSTLDVLPHPGGVVPRFERGGLEPISDKLAAEMRSVYQDTDSPPFLESEAAALLAEGRTAFADLNLEKSHLLREGRSLHLLLWQGTATTAVFGAALAMAGLAAEVHDLGVTLPETTPEQAMPLVRKIAGLPPPSADDVAEFVTNVKTGKFAELVPDVLARREWARQHAESVKKVPNVASQVAVI